MAWPASVLPFINGYDCFKPDCPGGLLAKQSGGPKPEGEVVGWGALGMRGRAQVL